MRVWVALIPLGALQLASGLFLLWDILGSIFGFKSSPIAWVYYELAQIGAVIGLMLGMVVSATLMVRSLRRQRAAEQSLRLASGAFMDVLQERFAEWELTPAEKDVALFSIKGLSTADIAALRRTSEGTVKAQTNAIYRKAGVSGRPQLLSLFIDELMGDPIGIQAAQPQQIDKAS
ncbi:MAG: helix-turn-helix transcriptional regulator [Pelagibaca sp.]